jgi:signal transduction protein with GAF and PtsI domain
VSRKQIMQTNRTKGNNEKGSGLTTEKPETRRSSMEKKSARKFYLKEFKAIAHAISTYEDLNLLFNHLAEGTCRTFEAKGCSIMLYDDREKQLFPVSSHGISEDYLGKGPIFADEEHSSFFTGEPAFVADMQDDPRVQYPKAASKEGIISMQSVPIIYREETIGIIRIYYSDKVVYCEEDVDALCSLALLLGLVIENNGLKNFLEAVKASLGNLPLRMLEGL